MKPFGKQIEKWTFETGETLPTTGIAVGSEAYEVDGAGNIVDFWLFDGTNWNH
jgi:hypothetical protein